ncbi:MAG: hypothetical protein ABJQ23_11320 [Shimia thalassica]|uniref:hypothetical protein n=1 Tax=Shimia thalassica TaxID=1715693 RepID=UPI003297F919
MKFVRNFFDLELAVVKRALLAQVILTLVVRILSHVGFFDMWEYGGDQFGKDMSAFILNFVLYSANFWVAYLIYHVALIPLIATFRLGAIGTRMFFAASCLGALGIIIDALSRNPMVNFTNPSENFGVYVSAFPAFVWLCLVARLFAAQLRQREQA